MFCTFTPFFQDINALKRRVKNNLELGLTGLYYDGPFPTFPHTSDKSTDGSREIIESSKNQFLFDSGENYIPAKFNAAVHEAIKRGFDSMLVVGSDEWIEGNVISLYGNMQRDKPINNVKFHEKNPLTKWNRKILSLPRLITNLGLVRLREVHWLYFYCDEPMVKEEFPILYDATIYHDDTIRPMGRNNEMTKYQDDNVPREREIIMTRYIKQILKRPFPPTVSKSGTKYYSCGCIDRSGIIYNICERHRQKGI